VSIAARCLSSLLLAGLLMAGSGVAQAHPHVWISGQRAALRPGRIDIGVRHAWTFVTCSRPMPLQGIRPSRRRL